jgi:tetratricopeptide (TPR) repeat protein
MRISGRRAAARSIDRVRLSGPQSSKALLGAGWADAAEKHYEAALAPWQELQGRSLLDAAVQESYLAVPYAYAELGAMAQSAEYYEKAIPPTM